jgi:phenylalanyl-tRNA synthetase beta chain
MNTSVAWLNDYLEPPATAQEQAELLTRAGFPLERREDVRLPDGTMDVRQDIELTSNRGDCLCHVGLAREIAAVSGRTLKLVHAASTSTAASATKASTFIKITNLEPLLCPLYTARVIRGVTIGPSPPWLAKRLIARGDIPRNNIVDASNFVLFELGQPTHVFDLSKLRDAEIIVRRAKPGEPFLPIGEGAAEVKLSEQDLVIADAERPVAIAGVKGGALSAVTNATTDIVLEAATFAPAAVRATSRRLGIASDSSYRFERGVHPGQIESAANRLAELILHMCGGTLCEGVLAAGQAIPPLRKISMRPDRCQNILGIEIPDDRMIQTLARLGFEPSLNKGDIHCTIPYQRLDIEREIDLIEEVGRIIGHDCIPVRQTICVRVAPPQSTELGKRAVNDALVGMGYVETITHTLISEQAAAPFLAPGMATLRVSDERVKAEPVLRPSILPSLLRVLALNRDNGVRDVKLFETGATFAMIDGAHAERVNLAMLHPAGSHETGLRELRGAIDRVVQILVGAQALPAVEPVHDLPWLARGRGAVARVNDEILGTFGAVAPSVAKLFGLDEPLLCAELGLPSLFHRYPPDTEARALPTFPAIERDVSAILSDRLSWAEVKGHLDALHLEHLEAIEFVTTFRGKQIGAGKKSLTLRLRFRAPDRTLKHDEVNPQMDALMASLQAQFGAEIRK